MTPNDFITAIAPYAVQSMRETKVPASLTIAQGALESAWGESLLAKQGHNLFGVKADKSWTGDTLTMNTHEFVKGKWIVVSALWRKYPDWKGCMDDHAAFFHTNKRYAKAFNFKDGESFAREIAKAGYATDPQYADKLISVMHAHNLARFDA